MPHAPRVFMVGWEYPPHNSGGLGVACEGLTQALAEQQTQIYFTLPYQLPQSVSHMRVIECQTCEDDLSPATHPPFLAYASAPPLQQTPLDPSILAELATLPQSEIEQRVTTYSDQVVQASRAVRDGFDVIHAHDWMSFPAAMKLQQKTGKPFIAHIHSTEMDRIPSGNGSHYIAHTEYLGMQAATKVIAVSSFTKRILIDSYGIDPDKIEVVYNGVVPIRRLGEVDARFAQRRPMIVFMGRLTAQKGAEYFLQLAQAVLDKMPEALFVVAGHGDQYHSLLFHSASQRLSASVLFTGFLRDRQRDALLSRADVFVMPSLSEPFGLVALEAAQRQTPVLVSENSGVKEVLRHALRVDFWDVQKMAGYIDRLVHDKEYAREIVAGQNMDLHHATWKRSASSVSSIYRSLLQKVR